MKSEEDMKKFYIRKAVLSLALLLSSVVALAQEVIVTVAPLQHILPPQVLLYISDPGKYFTIQLTNTTAQPQMVHLGLRIEQTMPNSGLAVATPVNKQPVEPITVPANSQIALTPIQMNHLFDHLPTGSIQIPDGLFNDDHNGAFGLLPEGDYRLYLMAYHWQHPVPEKPLEASNPDGGFCTFRVCYSAQAPQILTPSPLSAKKSKKKNASEEPAIAEIDPFNATFTWTTPVLTCDSRAVSYEYTFRVVEVPDGWSLDRAMDHGPFVTQNVLSAPMCVIPQNIITSQFKTNKRYAAQVTAKSVGANPLDYVLVANRGKSEPIMFRVRTGDDWTGDEEEENPDDNYIPNDNDNPNDNSNPNPNDNSSEGDGDLQILFGNVGVRDSLNNDSLYRFRNPAILFPMFKEDEGARKEFFESDIFTSWEKVYHMGGEGLRSDTLQFEYEVQVFNGGKQADLKKTLDGTPIFTHRTKDLEYMISWKDLDGKVEVADYLVLRIQPILTKGRSVAFVNDSINVVDFAMARHVLSSFFRCSDRVVIENQEPTTKKAADLKKAVVAIGEYELTIDEIKGTAKDGFNGKGHVEWNPMGFKVMLAVKFDSLKINSDNIVYGGTAVTYDDRQAESNSQCVDQIFSEWGLDNIINDMSIPYSDRIKQAGKNGVKNLAEKIDIAKYYKYAHGGNILNDLFLKGEVSDLHLPVSLPKNINPLPVDIQIVSMKFSPSHATMNVLGEFTLPETNYVKNNILVLGAPRLCVSPNDLLPESGTLALLDNFTINDPKTDFDFTFKAPTDVMEPSDGCFVSWHANKFEMFDIDVEMTIPKLVKVDDAGNRTEEHPKLRFHTNFVNWDDWLAEAKMDNFEVKDLKDWTFLPGQMIVYDHSTIRNADGMKLPKGYDKSGFSNEQQDDEWQGFYVKDLSVAFPKMLSVKSGEKKWNGRLKLNLENLFIDDSGYSFQLGMNNVFDFQTGEVGGWGISMKEIKMEVLQRNFKTAYFNGEIKTPLKGQVGYRCDIYAQGKDAKGVTDPNRTAYVFKTQQVKDLNFDFWLGKMDFDHDQTYFLVEAEQDEGEKTKTKVELCIGGDMSITIGRDALKKLGKVGAYVDAAIPGVNVTGMRIANCERWKSHYTQNQYESPDMGGMNDFFGWDTEYNIKADKFFFSLGRWSLSMKKKSGGTAYEPRPAYDTELLARGPAPDLYAVNAVQEAEDNNSGKFGPFDMSLKDFHFGYNNGKAILTIGTNVSILKGVLATGCSVDVLANVDTDKMDFSFDDVHFKEAEFKSGFGGISVEGKLSVEKNNKDEGYSGELTFALPGDFLKIKANGGYYKRKSGADADNFSWGYFLASAKSAAGIDIPPIKINGIKGGFYFNCKAPTVKGAKPTPDLAQKGVYGGMLGVFLSTTAGEKMLSADMDLTVVYDAENNHLSSILFNGTLEALKPSTGGKGLVNAECQLAYVNDVKRYIRLNVTSSGGASLDDAMKGKFKELTGKAFQEPMDVQQGLGDFTKDNHGHPSTDAKQQEPTLTAKCGFKVSLDFMVDFTPNQKTKWHLYIGKPKYEERCSATIIDFQLGKKTDAFAAWAYLGATMYLCLGNELPDEGQLPEPPPTVLNFLNGTDVNGKPQSQSGEVARNQKNTVNKLQAMFEDTKVAGGLMVGACAEGDFGVNAGIVYANGSFCFGFDLALENFEEGAHCQGGRKMGYHGWYGMGQAYAMLKGDLGVMIDLWFVKGKVSLIDVGLGALLQAGLPSPTWVYGKVRARCSLLGGLFKFNHAIEFKAGDVCMPDYGDPLDNIKIFASAAPGDTIKSKGVKELTSPYARPNFITNFEIDKTIRLVDENTAQKHIQIEGVEESEARANSERTYKFVLGKVNMHNATTKTDKWCTPSKQNNDATSFVVDAGSLNPNTDYEMVLTAYAKEFNKKTNKWDDPTINGKKQEKKETHTYYFRTGALESNLDNEVALSFPSGSTVRYEDATHPHISLKHCREDLSDAAGYSVEWRLWKAKKLLATTKNKVIRTNEFEIWQPAISWEKFITAGSKGKYKIEIIRIDQNWENASLAEKTTKTRKAKKQSKTTTTTTSSQPKGSATSPVTSNIKNFFDKEEKEMATSSYDVTTSKATAEAKKQDGKELLYTMEFENTVNVNFKDEVEFNTAKTLDEDIYMAVKNYTMTDNANRDGRTDEAMLESYSSKQAGFTFKDQYAAMSLVSNYLGIGGKKINKYFFYDQEVLSSKGITLDLMAGMMRKKTNVDGVLKVKPGSQEFKAAHLDFIPFLRSDGESANATARSGRQRYTFNEYNLNRASFTTRNVTHGPVKNTEPYKNFMDLFAGDAATVQAMLDDIRPVYGDMVSAAKEKLVPLQTIYNRLSANDKRLFNQSSQPPYGRSSADHLNFNRWRELHKYIDQTERLLKMLYAPYHNSVITRKANYHRYEINYDSSVSYFSTSAYSIPYSQVFLNIALSGALGSVGNVSFQANPVSGLSTSTHRNKNRQWAGQLMNSWGMDYTEYLKNLQSVTFDIWRVDAYNINLGKNDCYFDRNKRTYTVQDPFGYNVRKTIKLIK